MNTTTYILKCGAKHITKLAAAELDTFWAVNGYSKCHCSRPAKFVEIVARVTDTECGPKCRNAMGPVCDCKCGGEHHAEAHAMVGA